jgi:hypothetical protein
MATEFELRNIYTIQYQELLDAIIIFDKDFPDDAPGHNALVELARKAKQRAQNVGLTSLDPLPQLK